MIGDCEDCGHSIAYHLPFVGCTKCDCDEFHVRRSALVGVIGLTLLLVGCKVDATESEAAARTWATQMGFEVKSVHCAPEACYWPDCFCDVNSNGEIISLACPSDGRCYVRRDRHP